MDRRFLPERKKIKKCKRALKSFKKNFETGIKSWINTKKVLSNSSNSI